MEEVGKGVKKGGRGNGRKRSCEVGKGKWV